jgi:hypothetical protein
MLNPTYLLAYVILAIGVTALVAWLTRPPVVKLIAATITFFAFWLFGHIDDILGAREHRELCAKEAGVKVYKKANLPPEFYNADGTPNFIGPEGPDEKRLATYVRFRSNDTSNYPTRYLRTDKRVEQIVDVRTHVVLAEKIDFAAWPSPFIPSIAHVSAKRCPPVDAQERNEKWSEMYRRVFYR